MIIAYEWKHVFARQPALAPNRELPNPESVPHDKKDLDMRRGAGTPVPFPVMTLKPVATALKRSCAGLGISIATLVTQAPLVSVQLSHLVATQPTVDPRVVAEFVRHPDAARAARKHHPDGRQIDVPFVVQMDGCFYIYDGHHRCSAAVFRGDKEIVVRLLRLGNMKMSIIRAAGPVFDKNIEDEIDDEANSAGPRYKELTKEALSKSREAEKNPSAKTHQAAADAHKEAAKANAGRTGELHERDANKHQAKADEHKRQEAKPREQKPEAPKPHTPKDKAFQASKKADDKATEARRSPTKENHQAAAKAHKDAATAHREASTSKGDRNDRVATIHEGEAKHHESAAKGAKSSGGGSKGGSGGSGANQYGPYSQVHDQDVMTKQFIRARTVKLSVLDADGKPPRDFCIFPFGKFDTSKGTFLFDEKAAKSVLGFYKDQGNDLSIDYEHMAVCDPPVIAPAAGHFNLELRKDGLYAVQVRWTPRAAEMLKNKEYKYFSPAFAIDKETHRITKLLNIALTNIPATKNIAPLVAAKQLQSTISLARAGVIPNSAQAGILQAARMMRSRLRKVEAKMTARRRFTRGIVVGLAKSGFSIQSLVFPKAHWTRAGAKKWVKDHDFAPSIDETQHNFRFKQQSPESFESLTTICLTPTGARGKDTGCKIRAVGGSIKRKTKAIPDVVAEPMKTSQARSSKVQTRQKETTMARRSTKQNMVAASSAISESVTHTPASAEMFDKAGNRVDVTATDISHQTARVSSGVKKVVATSKNRSAVKLSDEAAPAPKEDSGDSADSKDSEDSVAVEMSEDSGDSADSAAPKEDSADSADSSDSADSASMSASDSDSDYEDSDDSDSEEDSEEYEAKKTDGVAAKKTPSNPDCNEAMSGRPKRGSSIATVVANVTGTRNRGEQIGRLVALKAAQDEIKTLSDKIAKNEARDRKNRVRRIVTTAIGEFRLMPKNREQAIKCGLKYGTHALRSFIKTFSAEKSMLKTESTAAKEADTSVKVVAAQLTREDREVMRKLGLDESSFVEARMSQETRRRTGQGRGAH